MTDDMMDKRADQVENGQIVLDREQLTHMNIEEFRAYLDEPQNQAQREGRFSQVAETLGITTEQLELELAIRPLIIEESVISVATDMPHQKNCRLVKLT